ncbi:UPF0692 protein C19orf54 homolog [Panonychus citri]|uniref:UPF0692 protein C19orf54 homolog n=1 Tax=Panonychus citri TaxID=50023 RepID=UPI002307D74C|nr:UPF0692 protein C19orf54 homolog [Panonychus citri]
MAFNPQRLPPPPPPPPPHAPFQLIRRRDAYLQITRPSFITLPIQHAPEESSTLIWKLLSESNALTRYDDPDYYLFSRYNQTISITQEGPTCGLVALMMALDCLGMSIPDLSQILPRAKQLGYTNHGEMYSALNLSQLVGYLVPNVQGIHVNNLSGRKSQFIEHLSSGWPILIPYDSDRNHYPCQANGYHAHWAVILGYCIGMKKPKEMNIDKILSLWEKDSSHPNLYHLNSPDDAYLLRDFFNTLLNNSSQLFLYAKQGKSIKVRLFDFDQLLKSNHNLHSTAPYSTRDLLIPEGGVRAGLSDQAILIKPKNV